MLIFAIDCGEKYIGTALSDETGLIAARDREFILRSKETADDVMINIADYIKRLNVQLVVVGIPASKSGHENTQTRRNKAFAERISRFTELPVQFWDESFTSNQAHANINKEKTSIHSEAARIMLQEYLDYKNEIK